MKRWTQSRERAFQRFANLEAFRKLKPSDVAAFQSLIVLRRECKTPPKP